MEKITQLVSCEFAVRQFLIKYPENMMDQMLKWSLSENLHVRRLASEGCRPRLPWAMAVPFLKKDYSGILPVLENLKHDPSEYVRRSVANNLNDISRDFPEVVLNLAARWQGVTPETDKILKHACRTMIKKGNDNCLKIFGFSDKSALAGEKFQLNRKQFELNDTLEFDFSFTAKNDFSVRLQYIVDYVKSNGKSGPKVFFLGERTVKKGEGFAIRKKVKLAEYTTRKLYEGKHKISIMVNGVTVAEEWFFLKIDR
jgi:3-methyladenine DNA glycosylase AlkC